ncbi:porin family protein [Carboxylicivirga taeanensis]|uniref:porin family protein n=1 Tax=Carboxylicivirga taeanensis TaxID=1416875 RepID=UPI003F6DEC67
MRKICCYLFVALLFGTTIKAQEFRAGPLVGASFSQVDGDYFSGYNKAGFTLGAFVKRPLAKHWDIQLDIAYIQKGSREAPNPEKGKYDDYKIHLDYIQFPLVARYQYRQFSAEGGVSVGVLLGSKEEIDGTPIGDLPEHEMVPFQDIEWASVFGLNYHVNERLWINARWLYSINRIRIPYDGKIPVYDPKAHWLSRKPGQYNNNFVLTFYYAFDRIL